MPAQTIICLTVFVITLILYMSNKFPLPLVSMTAMGVYVITGCLAPADALSCFSNSSVIIMGSMFIVAGGLNRTQMVHKVTDLAYKISGGSFQKGMILYCLVTLAIAQVAPSAILIFSICYPLVADFCRKNNQSPSKAMFSIVLISICTVTSLPIGSGATSYITANSLWETYGITFKEGMFDPMLVYLPTIILSVLFAMFYCPKVAPDYGSLYTDVQLKQMKEQKPLDPFREFMGYGIFVAVVIAILFSEKLPATIPTWMICYGAVDQSQHDPEGLCGAGTSGIYLYSKREGKFCGRKQGLSVPDGSLGHAAAPLASIILDPMDKGLPSPVPELLRKTDIVPGRQKRVCHLIKSHKNSPF